MKIIPLLEIGDRAYKLMPAVERRKGRNDRERKRGEGRIGSEKRKREMKIVDPGVEK